MLLCEKPFRGSSILNIRMKCSVVNYCCLSHDELSGEISVECST